MNLVPTSSARATQGRKIIRLFSPLFIGLIAAVGVLMGFSSAPPAAAAPPASPPASPPNTITETLTSTTWAWDTVDDSENWTIINGYIDEKGNGGFVEKEWSSPGIALQADHNGAAPPDGEPWYISATITSDYLCGPIADWEAVYWMYVRTASLTTRYFYMYIRDETTGERVQVARLDKTVMPVSYPPFYHLIDETDSLINTDWEDIAADHWPYTLEIWLYQDHVFGYAAEDSYGPALDWLQVEYLDGYECTPELCPPEERITHEFTFDYWQEGWQPMQYPGAAQCKSTPPVWAITNDGDGYWEGDFCSYELLQWAAQNTIVYDNPGIYTSVTITQSHFSLQWQGADPLVCAEVYASYNGVDWSYLNSVCSLVDVALPDSQEEGNPLTIDFEMSQPGLLAVTLRSEAVDVPLWSRINGVELTGCFDPLAPPPGECGFQDYEMDFVNGYPSMWWEVVDDENNPSIQRVEEGFVFGAASTGIPTIQQQTMVSLPGDYNLDIGIESSNPDVCQLYVSVDVDSYTIDCEPGVSQTVTLPLYDLASGPTIFAIGAPDGGVFLDWACLYPREGSNCLNVNPDFSEGLEGYDTTGTLSDGGVVLAAGERLFAIGVDYDLDPADVYELAITATEVVYGDESGDGADTIINDGAMPRSETIEVVTETRMITKAVVIAPLSWDGPTVWNWEQTTPKSRLLVSEYCITPSDEEIVYFDPRDCELLYNADFLEGTTHWTVNDVTASNSFAIFTAADGEAYQTANRDLISNTGTLLVDGKGSVGNPVDVEITVESEAGTYSYTNTFTFGEVLNYSPPVSGTTVVSVTSSAGFELDYICIWDAPAPPISITSRSVSTTCEMPPMMILTDTWDAWLPTVWPSPSMPDNFESMMAYNTLWVRYIGCFLKFELWGEGYPECAGVRWPWEYYENPETIIIDGAKKLIAGENPVELITDTFYPTQCGIRGHLDFIIIQIYILIGSVSVGTLASIISAIADMMDILGTIAGLIGSVVGLITDTITLIVQIGAVLLSLAWMIAAFLFTVAAKILFAIANPTLCQQTIVTDNYYMLAGWQLTQDAIALTPLTLLFLVAANVLVFKFLMWSFRQFK